MADLDFNTSLTVGLHRVEFWENQGSRSERRIEVRSDGTILGEMILLASICPRFAVAPDPRHPVMVIWTESEVFVLDVVQKQLKFYDHDDAVHAAYFLGGVWCLVADASVALVDFDRGEKLVQYLHDEIFVTSRWEGRTLVLEDLQNRVFRFPNLDPRQSELRPQHDS